MGDASGSETLIFVKQTRDVLGGKKKSKPEQITKEKPNPTKTNKKKGSKPPPKPNDKNPPSKP